uniref:Uncharacterized protein n=1 Tax=Tetranychus urticae TaxID=32264 RepID=T1KFI0_TETUR
MLTPVISTERRKKIQRYIYLSLGLMILGAIILVLGIVALFFAPILAPIAAIGLFLMIGFGTVADNLVSHLTYAWPDDIDEAERTAH